MKKDLCLAEYLTLRETLTFYSILYGCGENLDAFMDIVSILDMEKRLDQLLSTMSQGQKRRVSFCCAVGAVNTNTTHSKLMILDEPTVGMDPELRETVWNFLREVTSSKDVTTIITTHYIQEAEQAAKVGFLRNQELHFWKEKTRRGKVGHMSPNPMFL